jgi:DNA adenine methylase
LAAVIAPILRYVGSKARLSRWIVAHFPRHRVYVEPYCGSLTVLFAKPRSVVEIVNDRDDQVCNLFRVLRDEPERLVRAVALTPFARTEFVAARSPAAEPVEAARRTLVTCWQGMGCLRPSRTGWKVDAQARTPGALVWAGLPERLWRAAERLQGVQIENCPALDLLARRRQQDVLLYCDPPYLGTTRGRSLYAYEMQAEAEHHALLAALRQHPGPVVLSGYASTLYSEVLSDWRLVSVAARAMTGARREEVLWLNQAAAAAHQGTLLFTPAR